jgi:WD40 repeat protein
MALSPQGDFLAINRDCQIYVWETATRRLVCHLKDPVYHEIFFHHKGRYFACYRNPDPQEKPTKRRGPAEEGPPDYIEIYENQTGKRLHRIPIAYPVGRIGSGRYLVSRDRTLEFWGWQTLVVYAWDDPQGQPPLKLVRYLTLPMQNSLIYCTFSPDGRIISTEGRAGASNEDVLIWWDMETGKPLRWFRNIGGIRFAPNSALFAALTGPVQYPVLEVWEVAHGKKLQEWPVYKQLDGDINDFCFSPDSKTIAVCGCDGRGVGRILFYDLASGKELFSLSEFADHLVFTPDGQRFYTGNSRVIRLWDWATHKEIEFPMERK